MKDYLTISGGALPKQARVLGFRGKEGLSKLYAFEIFVSMTSEDSADFDMAAAVAQRATLKLDREGDTEPVYLQGVLAGVELVLEVADARAIYRLTLVPKLWLLTQTFHSRLHTEKSVKEVLEIVFKDAGLTGDDYKITLLGSPKPEEHVCQYRESDFDFVSRWMEREGLYYYFEHGEKQEKLLIVDDKSAHEALRKKAVPYHPVMGTDVSSGESFRAFACRHASLPASVKLKDYDYTKPTLDVSGSAAVAAAGTGELQTYGARFFTPDDGKRLAEIRAKQLLSTQVIYSGSGGVTHLRSGYLFELEEHPRPALNTKYLVVEMEHWGNQFAGAADLAEVLGLDGKDGYSVQIQAITSDVQFRPARATAWPRIYGVENALVDGPAESDYAQIDKHGRYHVKFNFDETDLKDGKASTWIRMLQPHAGNPEGFHFPLRKGTEVLVIFLGGDPDRPVIAGAVPNTNNPSPVTASNNTQNVIQTGGKNRFEIEDKDGGQYIDISSPPEKTFLHLGAHAGLGDHNWVIKTDGDGLVHTGGDRDIFVGGDQTEHVVGDVEENYDSDQDTVVGGDQTLEVADDCDEEIGGDQTLEVGGDLDEEIAGDQTLEVGGDYDIEVGGDHTLEVGDDYDIEVGGDQTIEIGGDQALEVKGGVKWDVTGDVKIDCLTWECKQNGEVSWETLGDLSHAHLANKHELVVGLTTDTKVGIKIETMLGGTLGTCIGAKAEITVAAQLEVNMGPAIHLKTIKLVNEDVKADKAEAELKECVASIQKIEAHIHKSDIKINSIMMDIWS